MNLKMDMVTLAFNAIKDRVLSTILSTEPSDSQFKTGSYRILVESGQVLYRSNNEEEFLPFEVFFKNDQVAVKNIVGFASSLAERHTDTVRIIGIQFHLKNELNLRPTCAFTEDEGELATLLGNNFLAVGCSTGSIDFNFSVLAEETLSDELITLIEGMSIRAIAGNLHYSDTNLKEGHYRCDLKGDISWSYGPEWYKVFPVDSPEAFRNSPVGSTPPRAGYRLGADILQVLRSYIDLHCNNEVMYLEFTIGKAPESPSLQRRRRSGPMISATLVIKPDEE